VAKAQEHQFTIVETRSSPTTMGRSEAIVDLARKARLVVTTGGTGILRGCHA
jgi:molybdopterin biosynthesis enzyme MoaB